MAKIDPASLFTEIRGTVGGLTFSKNRTGFYVQRLVSGLKSNRPAPQERRAAFSSASVVWTQIRNDEYNHPIYGMIPVSEWWRYFSLEPENEKIDIFGGTYTPTGYNWFQTYAMLQSMQGLAPLVLPPTVATPALWPSWRVNYYASPHVSNSYFYSTSTSAIRGTDPWITCRIQYNQSLRPIAPPFFFVKAAAYSTGSTPAYFQTQLESVFGSIPTNSRAYFSMFFRIPNGRISAAQTFSLLSGESYTYTAP
jgi:hypothetical protein